jgi:bifunctional UDP-N-acetylglucosamine pyrophosphorylase/glucosamine-1-phosphate N-acetyltransferase
VSPSKPFVIIGLFPNYMVCENVIMIVKDKHMPQTNLSVIILAAGKGSRMKSSVPKVCHPIGGLPMLAHVLRTASHLHPAQIITVISPDMPAVNKIIETHSEPVTIAYQTSQEGTGHAVMAALPALKNPSSDILVICGDTPMLKASTLQAMLQHRQDTKADVVIMSMRPRDPAQYGRIFMDDQQKPCVIVEVKDATPEQLKNPIANSGVMLISGQYRENLLKQLSNQNAQGEYLLTDVVRHAYDSGLTTACYEGELSQLRGVNDRLDLARTEQDFQNRCRVAAMENGATLNDPHTVTFSYDTNIAADVTIQPNVFFGPGVTVESQVTILGHSHIEGAIIRSGCTVGPFARIRIGTVLEPNAKVGNFVELKNAHLKEGSKVNHLSYIGDAEVGQKTNIGAGTITCNYDGFSKHKTIIGNQVFIGSNTALVAPIEIGNGAIIGAGSVITKTVSPDAMAFTRPQQQELPGGATRYRANKINIKRVKES